jgi:hypothetical protein
MSLLKEKIAVATGSASRAGQAFCAEAHLWPCELVRRTSETVNANAHELLRSTTIGSPELSQVYDPIAQQQAIHPVPVPAVLVEAMSFLSRLVAQ